MLKTPREINVYGALGCLGQPRAVKGSLGQPWRPGEALWRPQGFWNSRVPAGTSLVPAGTSLVPAGTSLVSLVSFCVEKQKENTRFPYD